MIAARRSLETSVRRSLSAGTVTCSAYVPGQTMMTSPAEDASTAPCTVGEAGADAPQSRAVAFASSSTARVAAEAVAVPAEIRTTASACRQCDSPHASPKK